VSGMSLQPGKLAGKSFRRGLAGLACLLALAAVPDASAQSPVPPVTRSDASPASGPLVEAPTADPAPIPDPPAAATSTDQAVNSSSLPSPAFPPFMSEKATSPASPGTDHAREALDESTANDLLNLLSWSTNSFLKASDLARMARELGDPTPDAKAWAAFGGTLRASGLAATEEPWLALTQALLVTSGKAPTVARSLGAIAAGVLRNALESQPPDWPAWDMTLSWLLHLSGESVTDDMGRGMRAVLERNPLDPEKVWRSTLPPEPAPGVMLPPDGLAPPSPIESGAPFPPAMPLDRQSLPASSGPLPMSSRPGIQAAVTLLAYGSPDTVTEWLVISPSEKNMLKAAGCWVFDNGLLRAAQLDLFLDALRAWQPGGLGVRALFVGAQPDASIQFPFARQGSTVEPGTALVIPWMSPEAWREPRELVPGMQLPRCPEQTAALAWECARVLQAREFPRRPYLRLRRDALLALSGRADNGLMAFMAILGWTGNPDDLFPALAVAWTGGCDTLFPAAVILREQGKDGPMALLLQMADLLSRGGDTFPLMVTKANGTLSRQEAVLRRGMLVPERPYPVAVSWGSELFEWDGALLESAF